VSCDFNSRIFWFLNPKRKVIPQEWLKSENPTLYNGMRCAAIGSRKICPHFPNPKWKIAKANNEEELTMAGKYEYEPQVSGRAELGSILGRELEIGNWERHFIFCRNKEEEGGFIYSEFDFIFLILAKKFFPIQFFFKFY